MLPYFKFHHIGVATNSIDDTSTVYEAAGYVRTKTIYDPIQNVKICFLTKKGMPMVELLAPNDEKSPICKVLEKNGVMPYHTCYEVENISQAVSDLKKMRYIPVSRAEPAVAMDNKHVQFMYHKDIGLIEIVEE